MRARSTILSLALVMCISPLAAQAPVSVTSDWPSAEPPAPVPGYNLGDAFNQLDVQATLRGIYDRFTDLTRRSGQDIRFVISEVKSYRPAEFEQVPLLVMMNPLRGESLQTYGATSQRQLPSEHLFSYRTTWSTGNPVDASPQIEALSRYTVADAVLMKEARETGLIRGLAAVSTFDVTVEFEAKTVKYSAAVWWQEYSPDLVVFRLVDNVTPGVAQYYLDSLDKNQRVVPLERFNEPQPSAEPFLPVGCVEESSSVSDTQRLDQFQGHSSGSHFSILNSQFDCSSRADCTSRCTVVPRPWSCGEAGNISNPLYTHRTTSRPQQSQILGAGLGAAAQCGFAIGCAIDDCFVGVCGAQPTITFGGGGAGIEATITGTTVSDLSVQSGANCPPTRLYPAVPPRCEEATASIVALPKGLRTETEVLSSPEPIKLSRLEQSPVVHHGEAVRYLMAEWAVVAPSPTGARARQRSSQAFDRSLAEQLALASWDQKEPSSPAAGEAASTLFVALPTHEANSRAIHIPDLQLAPGVRNPTPERGEFLVMADFAEDHQLQGLQLVHTETGAGSWKVMLALERALSLEPSAGGHRVVTFAWISVGETIKIDSSLSYLPRCCCGDVFCA
jgi:hypothetical protein